MRLTIHGFIIPKCRSNPGKGGVTLILKLTRRIPSQAPIDTCTVRTFSDAGRNYFAPFCKTSSQLISSHHFRSRELRLIHHGLALGNTIKED